MGKLPKNKKSAGNFLTPDRKETQEHLSNTLKKCLSSTDNDQEGALKNLTECMRQHPSWFGNHKAQIEPFLLKFLECPDRAVVEEAAVAFHFFQQTGSAGVKGINHSNNLLHQFSRLCQTVHALYDELFENETEVVEFRKVVAEAQPFSFSPYPSACSLVDKQDIIARKIINCLVYLKAMILESYPVNKPTIPEYLVGICDRGLSLHRCLKGCTEEEEEVSLELRARSMILSLVQVELMYFLRNVIRASRVLTLSYTITKMLVNTVKRSHSCDCLSSHFRVTTYKALQEWIPFIANSDEDLQETLLPLLTRDIVPKKAQVVVRVPQKNESKKRKHKSAIFAPQIEEQPNPVDDVEKQERCLHALKVLNCLIKCRPSPELTKIVASVIAILQEIYNTNRAPQPYTSVDCQAELHATLVALYANSNIRDYLNSPSIIKALDFLTAGSKSKISKISKICEVGLIVLEKIAHPECASLNVASAYMPRKEPEKINVLSNVVIAPVNGVNGDGGMEDDDVVRLEPEVSESPMEVCEEEAGDATIDQSSAGSASSSSKDDIIVVVDDSSEGASTSAMDQDQKVEKPPSEKQKADDDSSDDDLIAYFNDGVLKT